MKWIIFALISLMSFSLQSHYLFCQKEIPSGEIFKQVFYYNSSNGGLVFLYLDEFIRGTEDLGNPETYNYKLTDETNTEYVFTKADGRKVYILNKITGELRRFEKNKKNEWKRDFYFGYCNFVSTLKLPADSEQ